MTATMYNTYIITVNKLSCANVLLAHFQGHATHYGFTLSTQNIMCVASLTEAVSANANPEQMKH
jgi:hypothetical protein